MTATEVVDSLYEIDGYLKETVTTMAPPDEDPYKQRWAEAIKEAIEVVKKAKGVKVL